MHAARQAAAGNALSRTPAAVGKCICVLSTHPWPTAVTFHPLQSPPTPVFIALGMVFTNAICPVLLALAPSFYARHRTAVVLLVRHPLPPTLLVQPLLHPASRCTCSCSRLPHWQLMFGPLRLQQRCCPPLHAGPLHPSAPTALAPFPCHAGAPQLHAWHTAAWQEERPWQRGAIGWPALLLTLAYSSRALVACWGALAWQLPLPVRIAVQGLHVALAGWRLAPTVCSAGGALRGSPGKLQALALLLDW